MATVDIKIESPNPDLIAKVRLGIQKMLDEVGLDMDNTGRCYDLTLLADSDSLPPDGSVVWSATFDGAQNNPEDTVERLEKAYRKSFEHTTGPVEMHALRYAKALVLREFPTAAFLVLEDSDQGPGYVFSHIEDSRGVLITDDPDKMDEDLWAPLSDLREGYLEDHFEDAYRIPLDKVT